MSNEQGEQGEENEVRIIALIMIRNESRIIKRCISSCLGICDAVLVEDTGSTDDTVPVLKGFLGNLTVPTRLVESKWMNFNKSRTASFVSCQKFCKDLAWNSEKTYALALDADMVLKIGFADDLKKQMKLSGYTLVQKAGSLHYINMRLMRLSDPWTCVGATHEYWELPSGQQQAGIDEKILHIDDRNDGGCKSDKYERDLRLLIEELVHQPENPRTCFYLAQTYKCLGRWKDAIRMYKKRIRIGGWFEEVWFSHYMIAWLYLQLGQIEKMELWVQRALQYNAYRSEALLLLIRALREKVNAPWKAWHYLQEAKKIKKPDIALFLETDVYDWGVDLETVLLTKQISTEKMPGMIATVQYLMRQRPPHSDIAFTHIEEYVEPVKYLGVGKIKAETIQEYCASSISGFIRKGVPELMIRYVNYECSKKSVYTARSSDGIVRTRNMFRGAFLRNDPPVSQLQPFPTRIEGLEDMRIYPLANGGIGFLATSLHFSKKYRIVHGEIVDGSVQNSRVISPPTETECEKNWLMCPDGERIIYSWSPFKWGRIRDSRLVIEGEFQTPGFFERLRGSVNPVEVGDTEYWCLVHLVFYGEPRHYYHCIVKLDRGTLRPRGISMPFYFREVGVEYCLFMDVRLKENKVHFITSFWDKDPAEIVADINSFVFLGDS